jgi:hypothetical protein
MSDLNTLTKSAINALLSTPLTASQLKKKSHANLVALFDAMSATDALAADLRDARTDDPTPPTPKAPRKARTPRVLDDRVLIAPGKAEDVRPMKAGSKRHLMAGALAKGATIEEMVELLGSNKDIVSSALRTDMGALGLGVERNAGRYYLLLPEGVKRIPAHDAETNRAAALVALLQAN